MTVVRPLTSGDVPAAVALAAEHQAAPWSERLFFGELASPGRIYLAADDDGLVGFGGVMVIGEEAHVTNLLVVPGWRRKGIARRLLGNLVEAAVAQGARHLTLEVRTANEAARALYAGFGLVPVGVRKGYYGDDDALIMWAHDVDSPEYLERLRQPGADGGAGSEVRGTDSSAGGGR